MAYTGSSITFKMYIILKPQMYAGNIKKQTTVIYLNTNVSIQRLELMPVVWDENSLLVTDPPTMTNKVVFNSHVRKMVSIIDVCGIRQIYKCKQLIRISHNASDRIKSNKTIMTVQILRV